MPHNSGRIQDSSFPDRPNPYITISWWHKCCHELPPILSSGQLPVLKAHQASPCLHFKHECKTHCTYQVMYQMCTSTFQSKCTHFPASMLFAFPETPILSSFLELARGGTQLGGIPHYCSEPANFVWSVSSSPVQRQNKAQRNAIQAEAMKKENYFESTMSAMSMRLNLASVLLALSVLCRSCPAKL